MGDLEELLGHAGVEKIDVPFAAKPAALGRQALLGHQVASRGQRLLRAELLRDIFVAAISQAEDCYHIRTQVLDLGDLREMHAPAPRLGHGLGHQTAGEP